MKKFSKRKHDVHSPNLLPMIDVLFVLLAFLIIAANFSSSPHSVDINLPSTSYGSLFRRTKNTSEIKLLNSDSVKYQGELYALNAFIASPPKVLFSSKLVLSVDKEASFNSFVQIYAFLSKFSDKKVVLLVDPLLIK